MIGSVRMKHSTNSDTPETLTMGRKPLDNPKTSTERSREARERRAASGVPLPDALRRDLVSALSHMPAEWRRQVIDLACESQPPAHQEAYRRAAAQLLRLEDTQ